jgi:hypothetical protein
MRAIESVSSLGIASAALCAGDDVTDTITL